MSYQTREVSSQDGTPISFYEIVWGNTVWRYTSADSDQTLTIPVNNVPTEVTFTAVAISDSGMTQGGSSNNDITVTAQSNIPMADLFQSTPPSDEIKLTVRRAHQGDGEAFIHWKGFIRNVKRSEDNASIQIIGTSLMSMLESQGLRLGWCRGCVHVLYDDECTADPETFKVDSVITEITGNEVIVDWAGGKPEGYFTGGYIEWEANADGTLDRRGILASSGATRFTLLGTTYRIEVGMAIGLYPGCDLTTETCETKFDNLANYGGIEQMTGQNPFDGKPIL